MADISAIMGCLSQWKQNGNEGKRKNYMRTSDIFSEELQIALR